MAYNPQNSNGQKSMANSAPVVIASDQSAVPVSGAFYQTTQPVSLTSLPSLAAGSAAIGSITNTSFAVTQSTATSLRTAAESYQGGTAVSSTNPLYVTVASSALGVDLVSASGSQAIVSAAGTNPLIIKGSAGKVTGWYIYNSNANARKVAFHNTAGIPTAGSAVYLAIVIPGLSATNISFPDGIDFSAGIAITTVTGLPNSDPNPVLVNDLIINIFYK